MELISQFNIVHLIKICSFLGTIIIGHAQVAEPKQRNLDEVEVSAPRLIERKFGITKYNPVLHFVDASIQQTNLFEIAQVIRLPKSPSKITSVNFVINEPRKDSGIFRINFYRLENELPAEKLQSINIVQTKAIKEGWLRFDLYDKNIYLKGDVVVGIEFITSGKGDIKYEVKVGGKSKSYVRTGVSEWQIPPHHYRLFVTALVSDKKNVADDDEIESSPTVSMFSQNVKDSFSVFISTPRNYTKNKKYPVVYLLDANVYFDLLKDHSENILVGIGYKNAFIADSLRDRDYTFPKATANDSLHLSGGAPQFLKFIEQELIPYVDGRYSTDTANRTLMGHSLGGYFTLYALSARWQTKNYFQNYVAPSPSLQYANDYLVEEFRKLKEKTTSSRTLFITAGSEENLSQLPMLLDVLKKTSLNVKSMIFPHMAHMETAVVTFRRAIKNK
jgi:predicted alpha/beta superfamily hydrolase